MARPLKPRKVCATPPCVEFPPQAEGCETIIMAIDEYETIRLIDHEGMTQDECAQQMEVARTTVQAIYARARKKVARCIVQGARLRIEGGDIRFCRRGDAVCGQRQCCKRNTALPDTQE